MTTNELPPRPIPKPFVPDPRFPPLPEGAWKTTFGMFDGDELMKEIDAEGAKWREELRQRDLAEWDRENA